MPALAGLIFLIAFLSFLSFAPQNVSPRLQVVPISHVERAKKIHEIPSPKLAAKSAVVFDADTGQRLFDLNGDEIRPIASLTKLMSALVFLDHNPGWDTSITISQEDVRGGAKANIFVGDRINIRDLFTLGLVASDNTAIIALVRSTGLSEVAFVQAMNEKALELHIRAMSFADPTGLDTENKGNAVSVARLVDKAFKQVDINKALNKSSFEFEVSKTVSRRVTTTNELLGQKLPGAIVLRGGKTGHLDEAGYCFAGVFTLGKKHFITAVLGAPQDENRFSETLKIIDWTSRAYLWDN